MPLNSQATSSDYEASLLQPRDTGLIWAREFGTNTTDEVGDFYNADPNPLNLIGAAVDARLGVLRLTSNHPIGIGEIVPYASANPRGQTWKLPNWAPLLPFPSLGGDWGARVIYAKINLAEAPIDVQADLATTLIALGGPDMIGNNPAALFGAIGIQQGVDGLSVGAFAGHADAVNFNFSSGGGNPPFEQARQAGWPRTIYMRILNVTNGKLQDAFCWLSPDGLSWSAADVFATIGNFDDNNRIGIFQVGNGESFLDWVRVYEIPFPEALALGQESVITPPLRPTGGRIFTP